MTDLQREKEIAAKHKGYEGTTTCDVNYLLAELKDERSKLVDYAAAADVLVERAVKGAEALAEECQRAARWLFWALREYTGSVDPGSRVTSFYEAAKVSLGIQTLAPAEAIEKRAEVAEALVRRFAARCREIAVKDCGYWQEEYDDHEGVALLAEADRVAPAEAQEEATGG